MGDNILLWHLMDDGSQVQQLSILYCISWTLHGHLILVITVVAVCNPVVLAQHFSALGSTMPIAVDN